MYNLGLEALETSYFMSIPHFADCHLAIRVSGHSMYPKYCNGDVVVCKRIFNHNYVPYGEPHLVVMSDCYLLKIYSSASH